MVLYFVFDHVEERVVKEVARWALHHDARPICQHRHQAARNTFIQTDLRTAPPH